MAESEGGIHHLRALVERMGEPTEGVSGSIIPKVRPLVSIEQFFKGSNGAASMWQNQWPAVPSDVDERAFWRSIRDRSDVWDVLFSVSQLDFREQPFEEGTWVVADHFVIITAAGPEEAMSWFPDRARAEFVADSWADDHQFSERVFVPTGMKPLWFWYD
jgi:hypothetical protein